MDLDLGEKLSERSEIIDPQGVLVFRSHLRGQSAIGVYQEVVSEGFEKHSTATILEHPGYLPQGPVEIQVMQDALAEDDVEVFIGKRRVLGIHDLESKALAQPILLSFLRCDFDSGRGDVDGVHEQALAGQFKAVTAPTAAVFERIVARRVP